MCIIRCLVLLSEVFLCYTVLTSLFSLSGELKKDNDKNEKMNQNNELERNSKK